MRGVTRAGRRIRVLWLQAGTRARGLPRIFLVLWLRAYQLVLSPLVGGACRFYPSCSEYAIVVVGREGAWRGAGLALRRVLRCRPFRRGGLDLP